MTARRYDALDGLRGFAALVVFAEHDLLVSPVYAAFLHPDRALTRPAMWATHSPLHILWDGGAAVMVFFVLSGFVLTLPALDRRRADWVAYYPRRLIRLYVPVAVAVLLAVAIIVWIPRAPLAGGSDWLNVGHPLAFAGVRHALWDMGLIVPGHNPGWSFSPLWSLRWEVLFSLLLPVYVVVARRGRAYAPVLAVGALVTIVLSSRVGGAWAQFLPVFALGSLMAVRRNDLERLAGALSARGWASTTAAAWLLITVHWWLPLPDALAAALVVIGAALVVFIFLGNASAGRIARGRIGGFLGRISFSFYLVHEIVLVNIAFALDLTNPLLLAMIALPASLIAGWVFHRLVEQPSHRLSRVVGRRITALREPAAA